MITIRQEQMAVFNDARKQHFYGRIAAQVKDSYPAAVAHLNNRDLLRAVSIAAGRALSYGFEKESSLLAFVSLAFVVGPQFDEHPRISDLLRDKGVPADYRIEYLASAITADEWQEASNMKSRNQRTAE